MSSKKTTLEKGDVIMVIKAVVSGEYGVDIPELEGNGEWRGKKGRKSAYDARATAMDLCMIYVEKATTAKIGESFGGRDHATVCHAQRKVKDLRDCKNRAFCQLYERCRKLVRDRIFEADYYI